LEFEAVLFPHAATGRSLHKFLGDGIASGVAAIGDLDGIPDKGHRGRKALRVIRIGLKSFLLNGLPNGQGTAFLRAGHKYAFLTDPRSSKTGYNRLC
jgi:hypothetical protein